MVRKFGNVQKNLHANNMKSKHTLMIQGTTSDAGKSVMVAAICRILANHGVSVAPFKPQNMALNSAVTPEGGEIGRAQAVQAFAAKIEPHTDMNPILLKPSSDTGAQVILNGKVLGCSSAVDYHQMKPKLLNEVLSAHQRLTDRYKAIIVEGAGSPAEINLRDRDIANMGFAEAADCPVIIVADIDKGGVFAHLVGTYELLSESEKNRVVGFIINKFRGDFALLAPGNKWLEEKLGVPVLATIPFIEQLYIEPEDALDFNQITTGSDVINITVIVYPRISNHTDFDALRLHPSVNLIYARYPSEAKASDVIILPGSKNTIDDLGYLLDNNWREHLDKHLRYGGKLIGICGGMQMLGQSIFDVNNVESSTCKKQGLNYLPLQTQLTDSKKLTNVSGYISKLGIEVSGYEIHMGRTKQTDKVKRLITLSNGDEEGYISDDNQIIASYLHGLFDNEAFLSWFLTWVTGKEVAKLDYQAAREIQFEKLASEVEKHFDVRKILSLLDINKV